VFGHAGVDKKLAEMIHRWHVPGQLLAVGKLEHKIIIESQLVSLKNKLPSLLVPVNNFSNLCCLF
jgi:nucleolar protein 58